MFTTPCFIRKNTPELRKKLEELGYFYTYYHDGNGIYCYNNIAQTFTYNNEIPKECIGIPKDNEELFIAIAALRDDTDKNQWFISNVDIFTECYNNEWRLYENWFNIFTIEDLNSEISPIRKATVEEIIKHFKDK